MTNLIQKISECPTKIVDAMNSPNFFRNLGKVAIGLYVAAALTLGSAVCAVNHNTASDGLEVPAYNIK